MSLHAQFNITAKRMGRYSPLDQLSEKYLNQLISQSSVVTFSAGEKLFEKHHELSSTYYLLAGKLTARRGLLSSTTIDSQDPQCLHPINDKIPEGVKVKAQTDGYMLLIDAKQLDRSLALTESEEQERRSQMAKAEASKRQVRDEPQEFDEEYFNWMTSLLEFPLFLNLPPANIHAIFERFEKVEVKAGDIIIREGDAGDYFYLLVRGRAHVLVGAANTRVATLRAGAYFGEEALVSETSRSATVVMEQGGCLARLDKKSFHDLLHESLVKSVSYAQYKQMCAQADMQAKLLDIRSLPEFEHIPLPGCMHIPLADLRRKAPGLDRHCTYFLSEEGGQRNDIAAHILAQNQISVYVIRES